MAVAAMPACGRDDGTRVAGGVEVAVAAETPTSRTDAGVPKTFVLRVTITNRSPDDVLLVEDDRMPGVEATESSLVLHWDVEDLPPGTAVNINIFRNPRQVRLASGRSVVRTVEITNPVAVSNHHRLHWDTSTTPPTRVRTPPIVAVRLPATVRAVVGYGAGPFTYTSATVPQDMTLAFMRWQQRAESPPISVAP